MGVPLDAALAIRFDDWSFGERMPNVPSAGSVRVEVETSGGDEVTGSVVAFGAQLMWRPDAPLRAVTEHVMNVALLDASPLPSGASGPREISVRFTTGSQPLAPLALDSASTEAIFELYDATVAQCPSGQRLLGQTADRALGPQVGCPSGFGPCIAEGTEPMPHVRIELGAISGGQAELGYEVMAYLTDRVPYRYDFSGTQDHEVLLAASARPSAYMPTTMLVDLPEEEDEYTACIAIQIRDAAGAVFEPDPVCDRSWNDLLDASERPRAAGGVAPEMLAGAGASDPVRGAAGTGDAARDPAAFREACSASNVGSGARGPLLPIAALFVAWALRKRSHERDR